MRRRPVVYLHWNPGRQYHENAPPSRAMCQQPPELETNLKLACASAPSASGCRVPVLRTEPEAERPSDSEPPQRPMRAAGGLPAGGLVLTRSVHTGPD
jgi:hypothetical protein